MTWQQIVAVIGVPAIAGILLLALREYLRSPFASNKKVEFVERTLVTKIDGVEKALTEKFVEHKRNVNNRIDRVEALTLGNQNTMADHHERIRQMTNKVNEIERYGSQPSQRLMKIMQNMRLQQALIAQQVGAEVIDDVDDEDETTA